VIHAIGVGPLIEWRHLAHAIGQLPPRVLVRTYARMPVDRWDPDLAAFAPQTIERLADWACCWSASTPPASTPPTARPWTATR
jgi:hypothetical protein